MSYDSHESCNSEDYIPYHLTWKLIHGGWGRGWEGMGEGMGGGGGGGRGWAHVL